MHELLDAARASASAGDRPAVVDGERTLTYAELEDAVEPARAPAASSAGVARGDRVGLYLDKSLEALVGDLRRS